jgi:hypothetical protein
VVRQNDVNKSNGTHKSVSGSFVNILGTVYVHRKTGDGGDIYLTRDGLEHEELLRIGNWYQSKWFDAHKVRLHGTSAVYKVPTKMVAGRRLQLVVKNCRVGEDVPVDTHTLEEFVNAEFNSPWEEFALVMEMRESRLGPRDLIIGTQDPLAIYVPPERLQLWQTGRSRTKINKITRRHPGIHLDILKQYKLVYRWIDGLDIIQAFEEIGLGSNEMQAELGPLTAKAITDLGKKGYVVADMKAAHIIIPEEEVLRMRRLGTENSSSGRLRQAQLLRGLIAEGRYGLVDYELLLRTDEHEKLVKHARRHSYLDDQRDRLVVTEIPPHLQQVEILGVPYVHGQVESTGGLLWVVGRNGRLFDYFLPERWRKTPCRPLSKNREIYYTLTKDNVHLVWKTSQVGEFPEPTGNELAQSGGSGHFNSPFEEFAIAFDLNEKGIPTIYVRAIYMTGTQRVETVADPSRFESHRDIVASDGLPILREIRNYISIRGYYNGSDEWVAKQEGALSVPCDLAAAAGRGLITSAVARGLLEEMRRRLHMAGYDGRFLELNDLLIVTNTEGAIERDNSGAPLARICNLECLGRLAVDP